MQDNEGGILIVGEGLAFHLGTMYKTFNRHLLLCRCATNDICLLLRRDLIILVYASLISFNYCQYINTFICYHFQLDSSSCPTSFSIPAIDITVILSTTQPARYWLFINHIRRRCTFQVSNWGGPIIVFAISAFRHSCSKIIEKRACFKQQRLVKTATSWTWLC